MPPDGTNTPKSFEEALATLIDVDVSQLTEALSELRKNGYAIPAPPSLGRTWQPSPQAIATAKSSVTLMDIPVSIARYAVVKAEKKQPPSSAEWLRWLLADEQKKKDENALHERNTRNSRAWHSVAD